MTPPHSWSAPLAWALSLACAAGLGHSAAWAQPAAGIAPAQSIDVASQALGDALNAWARQTRTAIAVPQALVAAKTAPAVAGTMTPRQALDRLLAGSGLVAVAEGTSVVIRPAPAPGPVSTLAPVTVTAQGERETSTSPVTGLVARRSATGTKTDALLVETAQSVSVVGANEIEALKAQNLMDALGYVAGIARIEGADRTSDSILIRGFESWADYGSLYRDGLRYAENNHSGPQEPYGLERVEILKGAASVLYGAAAPGGVINTVSKRPMRTPLREINLEAGSFQRKQVSGDFGGAFPDDSDWSYRLTFLRRASDTFVDHVADNRTYIAPALTWRPSAATSLTLLSNFQQDRTAYVYALPAEGTVLPGSHGRIPVSRFLGEPGFDTHENKRVSAGYLFEHAIDDRLTLRQGLRVQRQSVARPFTYSVGLSPDQRSVARGQFDVENASRSAALDTSLLYTWSSGRIAHTTLAGVDASRGKRSEEGSIGSVADLDLYTPRYGAQGDLAYAGKRENRDRRVGVYAQDQMKIDQQWVVLVGGRYDWSWNDSRPRSVPPAAWLNERDGAFSGRLGLVHLVGNGLAPFVSFSQSFQPTSGSDALTGERLVPTRGTQYEAGVRYQPEGRQLLLSAAVYELTQKHYVVYDPVDFSARQFGQVRSRGVELEARAQLGRHTALAAAYTYTDARTKDPLSPTQPVRRTGGVPRNQLSLWLAQDFAGIDLPGFKAGVGMRHVGATTASYIEGLTVPGFTLVDAMLGYETGPWGFALNAANLFDRRYVASCTYGCFYGEPRKLIGTLSYRW